MASGRNIEVRRVDSHGQSSHSVYVAQEGDRASYEQFVAGLVRSRRNGFLVRVRFEGTSAWFSLAQFFGRDVEKRVS